MKECKNKNENRNKVIISITIVTIIVALVAGGTYAWWTWVSGNNTAVNITVRGMTMILDGGGDISSQNLVPTSCTNTTYAIQRQITYSVTNPTTIDSTATIQLNPSTFPTQLRNSKLMWKLTTAANCAGTEIANGTFSSTTQGSVMNLTTVSVPANTTTAITGTFYLSIWLDSSYSSTNTGNTVSDNIQDKTMNLKLTGTITQNAS